MERYVQKYREIQKYRGKMQEKEGWKENRREKKRKKKLKGNNNYKPKQLTIGNQKLERW